MELAPLYLAFLLLWLMALGHAFHYGRLGRLSKRQEKEPLRTDVPPCTIVITCHNQAPQLRDNLPALLAQDYPADYEVIVIDMLSTDETKEVLESLERENPHLHLGHCPATARDISLHRLALTLGIRAAEHEWVVMTQADCRVSGSQWLLALMQPCTEERDAVLGTMVYAEDGTWRGRRRQFFHLWQQTMWLPWACHARPYRADGACLCYRKSRFMNHQGFAESALLEGGAETLLVNRHVGRGRCAVNVRPASIVSQELPPRHRWRQDRVFFMAARSYMRQGWLYRLWYASNALSQMLFTLTAIVMAALLWKNPYVTGAVAVMWLSVAVVQWVMLGRSARQLGVRPFGLLLPWFVHRPLAWDTAAWLRLKASDKKTFRRKFV